MSSKYLFFIGLSIFWMPSIVLADDVNQGHQTAAQMKKEANDAWPQFIAKFKEAIDQKDKDTLQKMMSVHCSCAGNSEEGPAAAFQFWDDPNVNAWSAIDSLITTNNMLTRLENLGENKGVGLMRILRPKPPYNDDSWYLYFYFTKEKQWFLKDLTAPESKTQPNKTLQPTKP